MTVSKAGSKEAMVRRLVLLAMPLPIVPVSMARFFSASCGCPLINRIITRHRWKDTSPKQWRTPQKTLQQTT